MRHICITSPKGGVGKTILATNLAGCYARDGLRVCLVDHDPQGGSLIFGGLAQRAGRELTFVPTYATVSGFDLYVHDFAPGIQERYPDTILVMPVVLDAPSGSVHLRGRHVLAQRGYRIVEVVSRYRADRVQPRKLRQAKYADCPVVGDRTLYSNRYGEGMTVFYAPGAPYIDRAQAEIEAVRRAIDALGEAP